MNKQNNFLKVESTNRRAVELHFEWKSQYNICYHPFTVISKVKIVKHTTHNSAIQTNQN